MSLPPSTSPSLKRGLTLVPASAVIIATVIGTGIFVKARVMTCNVGSPGLVLLVYALAGVLTLAGALAYAELGAMMPRAGGPYNYLGAAYGRRWAFLYGWMQAFVASAASVAAVALVFVIFLNDLVGGSLPPWALRVLPAVVIATAVVLNMASVRSSGRISTALTAVKIALVLGVGVGAFVFGDGSWGHFAASGAGAACEDVAAGARLGLGGFGAAVIGALWSYGGWVVFLLLAGEVRSPERTLPRALAGAIVVIAVLYVFVNAAYFYVLTPEAVASVSPASSVAAEVAVRFLGAGAVTLMAAGLLLSSFGTLYAHVLTASRLPFALARDGMLPAPLARVSPTTQIPRNSVVLLGTWCIVLTVSGSFDVMTDLAVFAALLFAGLTVGAVFVLRRAQPEAERPYRVWGYPVVPALYLLAVLLLLVNTLVATPGRALAGLGLIALGLPVYAYYARRLPPDDPENWLGEQADPDTGTVAEAAPTEALGPR